MSITSQYFYENVDCVLHSFIRGTSKTIDDLPNINEIKCLDAETIFETSYKNGWNINKRIISPFRIAMGIATVRRSCKQRYIQWMNRCEDAAFNKSLIAKKSLIAISAILMIYNR